MFLSPLTSDQVLKFLPLNTWTEVHLQYSELKNVYLVSTKDKMEKRKKDMQLISLQSSWYHKVTQFKVLEIVAVEIEGKWYRGKLISFNEFQTDNTMIQLIDFGYVYQTKLENLFVLPYYFMYEPLALPVTFKDFIPMSMTFSIKPLLSESNLHKGAVLVDVNCNDTKLENGFNEKQLLESKININSTNSLKNRIVQYMINGHDSNESSLYISNSFGKDSFISNEKLNNVSLKNEDYCILTYFEDFTCLYVGKAIKCGNDESYNFVDCDTLLNTAESTDRILKYYSVVGDIVKVFSPQSDGLYRAQILKVNNGSCDVFYIDYGNIETIPSNFIYELTDELMKPGIAVRIGLGNLKDIQITEQIKNMFSTFCDIGKPFVIEFNENSKNFLENVKLKDIENGLYIDSKYIMKFTSIQSEESIQKPQNINENETVLINSSYLEVISNNELRTGDTVFCTHFEDFNHLYLCKCSKNNTTPENYSVIIYFNTENDIISKKNPKYKDIVRVKFEENIYRAKVLDKCGEKYSVFLIDIGKNIDVLGCNIYELPNSLKNIPGLALKVGLKGTTGLNITTTVKNYFDNLWQNEPVPLILKYDNDNFNYLNEVSLIEKSTGQDIVDDLVKMFSISNNMSNKPNLAISNSQVTKSNDSIITSNNWQSGDHVEFMCGRNVNKIFVRKIKLYEECKIFLDRLKGENSENYKPIPTKHNDYVAVYSTNNGGICRARVLIPDIEHAIMVKCLLIDFGKIDMIPPKNIFSLPDYVSLNKVPNMIRRVSLLGVQNIFNLKLIPYLSSLRGKTYVMEYYKNPGKWNNQNVILKECQSSVSLNDEIQNLLSNESSPRNTQDLLRKNKALGKIKFCRP